MGRPRKLVLVIADEQEQSMRAMQLSLWGYRVIPVLSFEDALARIGTDRGEMLAGVLCPTAEADRLRAQRPALPVLAVPAYHYPAAELRERIRLLTSRKRGPHTSTNPALLWKAS